MNLVALNTAVAGKTKTEGISPFSEIEVSRIYANPLQPRKNFENIEELAASIKTNGLLQPISVVKKENGRYMIIGGERRYRASLYAGLKTIKAHILQVDDKKVRELSLIENIQRDDLTDFETAQYIIELWASGDYAQKQDLAGALGKSQSYVSKALGTCKLDETIIADMQEQKHDIGLSVLEEISRVPDKVMQKEVYDKYVAKEIKREDIKDFKERAKISPEKIKKVTKEIAFDFDGRSFDSLKDDLKQGIIFHPLSHILHLTNLKTYKMYKITIEEM